MSLSDKITTIARLNWVRDKDVKEFIKKITERIDKELNINAEFIINEEAGEGLLKNVF